MGSYGRDWKEAKEGRKEAILFLLKKNPEILELDRCLSG